MDYIDSDVAPSRSVHQGQGVLLRDVSVANLGRTMLRSGLRCGLTECSSPAQQLRSALTKLRLAIGRVTNAKLKRVLFLNDAKERILKV